MQQKITVGTLNVVSLISRVRKQWLLDLMWEKRIDVLCAQETKIETEAQESELISFYKNSYQVFHSKAIGGSSGTAVFVRRRQHVVVIPDIGHDLEGRVSFVDCLVSGELIRVVSVYAPNSSSERKTFFAYLQSFLDTPAKVVLCGDYNCVLSPEDRNGKAKINDSSTAELRRLLHLNDLTDVTKATGKPFIQFTHWQGTSHARLDRIYVPSECSEASFNYEVTPVAFSDHALVTFVMNPSIQRKTHSSKALHWKLNESAFKEEGFRTEVARMIEALKDEEAVSACRWELFKTEVKQFATKFTTDRARERRSEERALVQTLVTLIKEEEKAPGFWVQDIKDCKAELLRIKEHAYRGAMIRCRQKVIDREETPAKVFKALERKRAKGNRVAILLHKGKALSGDKEIQEAFFDEYTQLFQEVKAPDPNKLESLLSVMPKISEDGRSRLEEPISADEVARAIKELPTNKSPGIDGIGSLFYKTFALEISVILAEVFSDIYKRNLLPPSMRKALTVLIPKKMDGTIRREVRDYRPISLLTTDYKILAKILARRLQLVLPEVIGKHQVYGCKGRNITRHLHIMRTIWETASGTKASVAVMQADLSQAFDRVCHSYLFALLNQCNVGPYMERWLRMCYNDISTRLVINGARTKEVPVRRSVRQGCPLSPILFALYLEPLCRTIIADQDIRGFFLSGTETKLMAYADDVAIVCSSQDQLKKGIEHIEAFGAVAGAKINLKKTVGSWLGKWELKPAHFLGATWTASIPRYLGVKYDEASSGQMWQRSLNLLGAPLQAWSGRSLSLFSRSYICNATIYPAVLYYAQAMPCDDATAHRIHRLFATFVWRSKLERMRRTNLFLPLEKGGLGLVNVSIKLMVRRFLYFRDTKDPCLRAALQVNGFAFLRQWVVTSDLVPNRKKALGYYKEMGKALDFFSTRFSWEYLLSVKRKKLYWDTVDLVFPPPRYRELMPGKADVFKRIRKMPVSVGVKNVFVLFHTETLPVKTWQVKKGFSVPWSLRCDHCYQCEETLQHAFLDCPQARQFWACIREVMDKDVPIEWRQLKFLDFADGVSDNPADLIGAVALYAWWTYRSDFAKCEHQPRKPWVTFLRQLQRSAEVIVANGQEEGQYWELLLQRLSKTFASGDVWVRTGREWPRLLEAV